MREFGDWSKLIFSLKSRWLFNASENAKDILTIKRHSTRQTIKQMILPQIITFKNKTTWNNILTKKWADPGSHGPLFRNFFRPQSRTVGPPRSVFSKNRCSVSDPTFRSVDLWAEHEMDLVTNIESLTRCRKDRMIEYLMALKISRFLDRKQVKMWLTHKPTTIVMLVPSWC